MKNKFFKLPVLFIPNTTIKYNKYLKKGCEAMAVHIVGSGDTLWTIAQKYGVPISSILSVNGLNAYTVLMSGLALYIPTHDFPIRFYRIQSGDTFWNIASTFNTSVTNLVAANPGIDFNLLYIGQKINIPSPLKMNIQTLGFILPFSPQKSLTILNSLGNKLTYLVIVSYSLTSEGMAYMQQDDTPLIAESKRLGIRPLLMIRNYQNEQFSPTLIGGVLENPAYRSNLVTSITNLVKDRGFAGVSIDFEFIPPPRRIDFILFLRDLKSVLGNLVLHVNVHAKTEDIPTNRIIGAYDYKAIGQIADIVGIMTIDYGYPGGPPNPVSPIGWVEEVIQYSINLINPSKIQIALPLYAYDWRLTDNKTTALSVLDAQNSALQRSVFIQFDPVAAVPWFSYRIEGEEHMVWFEDIRSIIEKYKLIDYYQLQGATYWHIGLDFPQNWAYVEQTMKVIK